MIWYEGSGVSDSAARTMRTDYQGSVILVSDADANVIAVNRYDEWGIPASGNLGRFQYTGQAWIPELTMYYYKARIYSPTLGRFLQTDPIGYDDQINLYAYVGNDPVNGTDPSGEDSIVCNIVDGKATGRTFTADKKDTTTVTYNETRNYTGADGKEYTDIKSTTQTYQGSISQEGMLSRLTLGTGDGILKSVGKNLSTLTGTNLQLSLRPATESSRTGSGADALGAVGGGRQFNGRPGPNQVQNRQVNDAAREAGLNAEQRHQLGRAVEQESPQGGANLGYRDVRAIADAIKSGRY